MRNMMADKYDTRVKKFIMKVKIIQISKSPINIHDYYRFDQVDPRIHFPNVAIKSISPISQRTELLKIHRDFDIFNQTKSEISRNYDIKENPINKTSFRFTPRNNTERVYDFFKEKGIEQLQVNYNQNKKITKFIK